MIELPNKNKTRMENILLDQVLQQVQNKEISIEKARELICVLFSVSKPFEGEPLFCYHEGSYTLNDDGTCCKCHRLPKPKAK